jgi:hypothetical protein
MKNYDDLMFIGGVLIFLCVLFMYSSEHMSNKELLNTLEQNRSSKEPSQAKIYGPKATKLSDSEKKKKDVEEEVDDDTRPKYPDIYGPDVPMLPGTSSQKLIFSDDPIKSETYDYNPDLKNAFPVEGPPQPYLADFAPFKH